MDKTLERVLIPEEERIKEIEQAIMKETGSEYLTADIKHAARMIFNKWRAKEPTLAQALSARYIENGEGILPRYDGQPIAERKQEVAANFMAPYTKEEREEIRESLKHPKDTTYCVERIPDTTIETSRNCEKRRELSALRKEFWSNKEDYEYDHEYGPRNTARKYYTRHDPQIGPYA